MSDFNTFLEQTNEVGYVTEITQGGILYCDGLPGAKLNEVVLLETGEFGKVFAIEKNAISVLVFSNAPIRVGTKIARTGKPLSVPVGKELLGMVVTPLCTPAMPSITYKKPETVRPLDATPLDITARRAISKTLATGVTTVDMLIPLAKGQRELVIGDRKTGKSNLLLKTMLTQARAGMICIYAAIGKKLADVKRMEEFFIEKGVMKNIIIITAGPQDPNALLYIAPFTAITIAEHFRDQGIDSLVILDDLSTHARFCREISLLARQFPGRDSYPVDIFYIHAKLLERAGNFAVKDGQASITALPVAETNRGDLSGYIQTNLMSMTDGHIYNDQDLFAKGRRPAINPFLSVTRVGHQAQSPLRREISKTFLSFLTQHEKLQSFVHFGAELNEETKEALETGEKLLTLLHQHLYDTTPESVQVILFALVWARHFNHATESDVIKAMDTIAKRYETDSTYKTLLDTMLANNQTLEALVTQVKSDTAKIGLQPTDHGLQQ